VGISICLPAGFRDTHLWALRSNPGTGTSIKPNGISFIKTKTVLFFKTPLGLRLLVQKCCGRAIIFTNIYNNVRINGNQKLKINLIANRHQHTT